MTKFLKHDIWISYSVNYWINRLGVYIPKTSTSFSLPFPLIFFLMCILLLLHFLCLYLIVFLIALWLKFFFFFWVVSSAWFLSLIIARSVLNFSLITDLFVCYVPCTFFLWYYPWYISNFATVYDDAFYYSDFIFDY